MARARTLSVTIASVIGSFAVYGAHVACGPGVSPRGVATAPAQTVSASSTASVPAPVGAGTAVGEGCGCASPPKVTASFAVSGDEKIALDPLDSTAELEVTWGRSAAGKKTVVLSAVVRGFRTDLAAERPTTVGLRLTLAEGATQPASNKDIEAYVTAWGASPAFGPRAYAVVTKSALTVSLSPENVEIKGSLTLKDGPANRTVTLDKVVLRKSGPGALPPRGAAFRAP